MFEHRQIPIQTDHPAIAVSEPAFRHFFHRTMNNAMIILNESGIVVEMNECFIRSFGYSRNELLGHSFNILFTEEDNNKQLPANEIISTIRDGHSSDENFIVHKDGTFIWLKGECILISDSDEPGLILKTIQDINTQRVFEKLFNESQRYIDHIFESVKNTILIVTDLQMNIIKTNHTFRTAFSLSKNIYNRRLCDLDHAFWKSEQVQRNLRKAFKINNFNTSANLEWTTAPNIKRIVNVRYQLLRGPGGVNNKVLMIISDIS